MSKKLKELISQIASPKIKCVSFDLFDTLVQRPIMKPEDVFILLGNIMNETDFFSERRVAASKRAMLLKDYYSAYVTLDDIYNQYAEMFHVDEADINKMKQSELELEYNLIFPRESMKKIFYFAKEKGKKVIITTDMYLPSDFLKKVLENCGYGGWDKLYVSCEENATKRNGELYDKILSDLEEGGIFTENILHIGDNFESDINKANERGMNSYHIPSAMECFNNCNRLKVIKNWNSSVYSGTQNLLIGLMADLMFDDPFISFDQSSRFNGEGILLGEYIAPFVVSYCLWMVSEMQKDKIDNMALVWRDGYIPQKVINILYKKRDTSLPEMHKGYLNRALRYGYVGNKKGGLFDSFYQWKLNPKMTVNEFARKMMNCKNDNELQAVYEIFAEHGYVSEYEAIGNIDKYIWFVHELETEFQKNHLESNEILKKHIEIINSHGKLGIFDIGYRGTVSRFLWDYFSIETTTYHMLGTTGCDDNLKGVHIHSYITYGQNIVKNTKNTLHKFMELIISEQMASIIRLKNEHGRIVPEVDRFFEEDAKVLEIQKGIIKYTEKFSELFFKYYEYLNTDKNVLFVMITSMLSSPAKKDAEYIRDLNVTATHYSEVQDDFSGWYDFFFGGKK